MCIFNLNSMLGVNSSPQHVAPFPNIPPQNLRNGAPSPPRGGPYFVSRRRRFCVGWGKGGFSFCGRRQVNSPGI